MIISRFNHWNQIYSFIRLNKGQLKDAEELCKRHAKRGGKCTDLLTSRNLYLIVCSMQYALQILMETETLTTLKENDV